MEHLHKHLKYLLILSIGLMLAGCQGGQRSTPEEDMYRLYLDISMEKNFLLNRYDVDVSFDGEDLTRIKHGKSYETLMMTTPGSHTITFYHHANHNVKGSQTINVDHDMTWSCTLRAKGTKVSVDEVLTRKGITKDRLAKLQSVTIDDITIAVNAGGEALIKTVPEEAAISDVTIKVKNKKIVRAEVNEKVITVYGLKKGTTTITCRMLDNADHAHEVTFTVTVEEAPAPQSSTTSSQSTQETTETKNESQ